MKKAVKKDNQVELKEQLARALADYDNLKKRVEREQSEQSARAKIRVVANFLPVFDMFDEVCKHVEDSGLAMAMGELTKVLSEEGITPIEPKVGDKFSEEEMEAVEAIEKPEEAGKVAETILRGYKMGDWIVRYAKVVVYRGKLALDSEE